MIAEICFTADWLEKKRKELKGVDPGLLERALHALALLRRQNWIRFLAK